MSGRDEIRWPKPFLVRSAVVVLRKAAMPTISCGMYAAGRMYVSFLPEESTESRPLDAAMKERENSVLIPNSGTTSGPKR